MIHFPTWCTPCRAHNAGLHEASTSFSNTQSGSKQKRRWALDVKLAFMLPSESENFIVSHRFSALSDQEMNINLQV